ncbi:unknown [Haloarcula marismortui ATCC 43049]|uniref:Uncharacterized protein n=1 Tax=Haloarcula marismortui (strain ATCC 43049 / DSM 3752 / JCM 8966 / VKM B-1809) TaxID=272569 RepID=Q5UYC0_HALMA|nr:unknown [Haloarcula marismortui ATCC 43049]
MSWPGSASKSSTVAPTSSSSSDSLDEDAPQELLLDEDDDSDDDEAPHFEALSSPVSGVVSVDELAELAPHLEAVSVSASASLAAVPSSRGPCPLERSAELRSALLALSEALRASLAPHFDSVSVLASVVLSVLIVRNRRRHARRAG